MNPDPIPFDPDGPATGEGIFGLPHTPDQAGVILIPVPWEATASYGLGAADGPQAILQASAQVDLFDRETGTPYESGIAMLPIADEVRQWNERARELAEPIIEAGGEPEASQPEDTPVPRLDDARRQVDELSERLNGWVYEQARIYMDQGKRVGVVGGDHSSPFGAIRAAAEQHPGLGILHLDAHADLRNTYLGFTWSHASIFHNVYHRIPEVSRIVQVGVRDFSTAEDRLIRESKGRIVTYFDPDLRRRLQEGESWAPLVREMIEPLPDAVYLSFDIDGLDPSLCPNTGTPVPGGLSFDEAVSLVREVAASGRSIVGFDLCEVAPDPSGGSEWDGNVGARLLYKMIGYAVRS